MDNFAAPTTFVVARGPPDVSPVGDCVECFRVPSRKMGYFCLVREGLSDIRSILIAARACGAGPTEPRVGFQPLTFTIQFSCMQIQKVCPNYISLLVTKLKQRELETWYPT